jgi:hypothetical protein
VELVIEHRRTDRRLYRHAQLRKSGILDVRLVDNHRNSNEQGID